MGTFIVAVIVFAVLGAAVYKLVSDKKKGKSSCGCGCENCPSSGMCHSHKE